MRDKYSATRLYKLLWTSITWHESCIDFIALILVQIRHDYIEVHQSLGLCSYTCHRLLSVYILILRRVISMQKKLVSATCQRCSISSRKRMLWFAVTSAVNRNRKCHGATVENVLFSVCVFFCIQRLQHAEVLMDLAYGISSFNKLSCV